jgi:Lon protease-like protein
MKPFSLIQLYFVLATLVGLILIIIGSVTVVKIGLDQVVGVKPYPEFSAPYPPSDIRSLKEGATESQAQALAKWEQDYNNWQEEMKSYNAHEQQIKRDIAQSLAMLLVGIPVFLIHSPRVFKKTD